MKNLIKIAIALALTLNAHAQDFITSNVIETPTSLAVFKIFPEHFRLRVYVERKVENSGTIFLYLRDAENKLLYKKIYYNHENQQVVLLGLAELQDGVYSLEMSDKSGTTTKTFRKAKEPLVVQSANSLVALNN